MPCTLHLKIFINFHVQIFIPLLKIRYFLNGPRKRKIQTIWYRRLKITAVGTMRDQGIIRVVVDDDDVLVAAFFLHSHFLDDF